MDPQVGALAPSGPATTPTPVPLHGRYTSLVPLSPSHAPAIFKHLGREENAWRWAYLFNEPFLTYEQCEATMTAWSASRDPLYFTILSGPASDPASEPVGVMGYLSIVPEHRRIEIGCIIFSERLKQTRGATEAAYLMLRHAVEDLGNLRVEWKLNHFNKPSYAAAERLGFSYEGTFRRHMIIKGRYRDTAWFSITDEDWPVVKGGLESWLSEENFDKDGQQRQNLRQCREAFKTKASA